MPPRRARSRPAQQSSPVQNLDPALQNTQNTVFTQEQDDHHNHHHHQQQQQEEGINPDDVFLELPSLYANADAILKLLMRCGDRQGIADALADPNSRLRQRMERGRDQFGQQQALFGTSDNYINPNTIAEALFFDHPEAFEAAQQRDISLHDIIYKINVAAFLYTLCDWHDLDPDQEIVINSVRYNDGMFPVSFMARLADNVATDALERLPTGTSRAKPETLALGASMRTQLAISEMRQAFQTSQGADPSVILRQIFYDDQGVTGPVMTVEQLEQQPLRRWHFGTPLSAAEAARIKEFITAIEQVLPDQSSVTAFEPTQDSAELPWMEALLESYPWSGFVLDSASWAQSRAKELTTQIQLRGGADELVTLVETLRSDDPDAMLAITRLSQPPASTFTSPQPNAPLLATPQRSAMTYATSHPAFQGYSDSQGTPPVSQRASDKLQANLTAFATKTIASMSSEEQQVQSLLDTQANGEKVPFSDSLPHAAQSPPKRKRGHDDDDEDVDITPVRSTKRSRQGIYGPGHTEASPINTSTMASTNPAATASVFAISQQRNAMPTATQFDEPDSQQQARLEAISQSYDSVKRAGKDIAEHRKAELKAEDDRKVQERKRWTREETTALIAYIEELGTSWAMIQKTDQARGKLLQGRDQVALKDKARNLKFEYLKANAAVPKNFDGVSLSKSMRDKLAAWNGPIVHPQDELQDQMHNLG